MLEYSLMSEIGDRKQNEDSVGMIQVENRYCFILADGLGGHGGGADASQMVVDCVKQIFEEKGEISQECMAECFQRSQDLLLEEQQKQHRENEMKTTLVILMMDETKALWGHVGDSRLYVFEKGKYTFRTLDHSVPQMLVASGEITEKEIRGHADRNRLLRVMGAEWNRPGYQISEERELTDGMSFLLCTDGFWELIEEKKMESAWKKAESPEEWIDLMRDQVKKKGAKTNMDNYSAIAVFIKEDKEDGSSSM